MASVQATLVRHYKWYSSFLWLVFAMLLKVLKNIINIWIPLAFWVQKIFKHYCAPEKELKREKEIFHEEDKRIVVGIIFHKIIFQYFAICLFVCLCHFHFVYTFYTERVRAICRTESFWYCFKCLISSIYCHICWFT